MYETHLHSSHIPQPPHSAGLGYKGLRPRIHPSQVPSPIDGIEADRQRWEDQSFSTLSGKHAPLSTTNYIAVDQGNASPKFVRASTWAMPSTSRLANDCNIPICAVFQPFAQLEPQEEPVALVDATENGPVRCERCRAYVSPWSSWVLGGSKWKCNLCSHETEVPSHYFCNLDQNGLRLDHAQRPELIKGVVDFVVPKDYWALEPPQSISRPFHIPNAPASDIKQPQPLNFVFVFDVSTKATQSGFLAAACLALKSSLYGGVDSRGEALEPCFPPESEIAIITFDETIHFYDLSAEKATMMVVGDIEEVFVPLQTGLFVNPVEHRDTIESLLDSIPKRFSEFVYPSSALGSTLRACQACLFARGGQVVIYQSILPRIGDGALSGKPQPSEDALYDTDKEKILYRPQVPVWTEMGEECASEGIGVNIFFGNHEYIDVGSIGALASISGGEMFFHPRFENKRDEHLIVSQTRRIVSRMQGYNCTAKVRCSKGIRVTKHFGNFYQQSPTDIEFGVLDCDKAFSVQLEHTSSLNPREYVFLQLAVLYTSIDGQRRVRVCNLSLQVVELAGNVFQYADMDTVVHHMSRQAVSSISTTKMSMIRSDLTENCASILLGYRNKCASSTQLTQLVIPEAFKSLPMYTLAALKSKPLKARSVSSDVRNFYAHRMMAMSVRSLLQHLYPQMLALHNLTPDVGIPDASGRIVMPPLLRNTYTCMEAHGVYIMDNEEVVIIWIGAGVNPQLMKDLFDVPDLASLDRDMSHLPVLDTLISTQVRNIMMNREKVRGRTSKLFIARQNMDGAEVEFSDMLVEDQNNGSMPYIDYLTVIHNQISTILREGGSMHYNASAMRSPW